MTYTYHTLPDWNGNNKRWPSRIYTERNDDGFEVRKLIVHPQGGVSFASEGMQQGTCFLEQNAYTALNEGTQEPPTIVTRISQAEFEETWQALVLRSA